MNGWLWKKKGKERDQPVPWLSYMGKMVHICFFRKKKDSSNKYHPSLRFLLDNFTCPDFSQHHIENSTSLARCLLPGPQPNKKLTNSTAMRSRYTPSTGIS